MSALILFINMIDSKLAKLLSDFTLDIAKAFFVAAFVTQPLSHETNLFNLLIPLYKSLINVILFILVSRQLLNFTTKNDAD